MGKNKLTFSQQMIVLLMIVSCLWVTWSYVLATFGREPVENLGIAIVSTLIIALLAYFGKSFGEKNSRNKYNIAEDGIPYGFEREEKEDGYNDNSDWIYYDNDGSRSSLDLESEDIDRTE